MKWRWGGAGEIAPGEAKEKLVTDIKAVGAMDEDVSLIPVREDPQKEWLRRRLVSGHSKDRS